MKISIRFTRQSSLTPDNLSYFALAAGILSIGFSGIFVRWANAPGPVLSFYRVTIATIVLAYPFWKRVRQNKLPARGIWLAILGGLFFGGDMALWATGVMLSGATIPTLLANTAPVWVGIGALLIFRERLNKTFWAGLGFAFAGAIVVMGLNPLRGFIFDLGAWLGLLSGLFYAGYFLVTQKGRRWLDALSYLWIVGASSAVLLLIISQLFHQPLTGYPAQTYLSFLGIGLVSQVFGWLAINYALGHLPATIVAPVMLGQPVMTAILAAVLLSVSLTLEQFFGALAVLMGVYFANRGQSKTK